MSLMIQNSNSRLFKKSIYYKPFYYDWAFEAWKIQHQIHWIPEEVQFTEDIKDWEHHLTKDEQSLLFQIFRFFTQADIEVSNCYIDYYLSIFKNEEIQRMLIAFADMETIHIEGYSQIIETINMPESEYKIFMEYEEMKNKWNFLQKFRGDTIYDLALTVAVFGAFVEGVQLFASFVILMFFPMKNKMKGMGQIVTWSVRDETLHVMSMCKLFHTIVNDHDLDMKRLHNDIEQACEDIIHHEDRFIDLAFKHAKIKDLDSADVKRYIRYIANNRLEQLGLKKKYNIDTNPFPWMDYMLGTTEITNFFENKPTEYSKGTTSGSWQDIF